MQARLLIWVVAPVAVCLAGFAWLTGRAIDRANIDRLAEEVELVARAVEVPLGQAVAAGQVGRVGEILQSLSGIKRLYAIHVYDNDGDLLAGVGETEGHRGPGDLHRLIEDGSPDTRFGRIGERRVYSYFAPLTDMGASGLAQGVLQVSRPRRDFEDFRSQLAWQIGLSGLGLGSVFLVFVVAGHHLAIGRQLQRLAEGCRRIAGGDRGWRAPVDGPRELALVADEFNAMLDRIQDADQELRKAARREAAMSDRLRRIEHLAALGRVSAGVAHELGTPLSVIDIEAQRLAGRADDPARIRRSGNRIRDEIHRLGRIIEQLLQLGLSQGPERAETRLGQLLPHLASEMAAEAAQQGVSLQVQAVPAGLRVPGDPVRVELALRNLIRNAFQASPGGIVQVGVEALADGSGGLWCHVRDDGPGVDPADRERILEPFYTTRGPVGGTGLGLAIVRSVIEEIGGVVDIRDAPAGGAEFRLYFPPLGSELRDGQA